MADRQRRLFLTAKFDRTWSALTQLRTKVGAARFRDALLSGDDFSTFLAEVIEVLEAGSDPGALWAKWIDVRKVTPRCWQAEIDRYFGSRYGRLKWALSDASGALLDR